MITVFAPFDLAYMELLCDQLVEAKSEDEALSIIGEMEWTLSDADFESVADKRDSDCIYDILFNLEIYAGDLVMTKLYVERMRHELSQWVERS